MFPEEHLRHDPKGRIGSAWRRFWHKEELHDASEFDQHEHAIKTLQGIQ